MIIGFWSHINSISCSRDFLRVILDTNLDTKGLLDTIHLKKILMFLKLIYAIYYSDNLTMYLIPITNQLWVMSEPIDLKRNTKNLQRRMYKLYIVLLILIS